MRYTYCPDCGSELSHRDLGDDKDVPWCDACAKPWFDIFPTCIIALVHDRQGRVLLLRQGYISHQYANLVSGYMAPGETAEECARREIQEETGLTVTELKLEGTHWFAKKGLLMIGFFAEVADGELRLSSEVDSAAWYPAAEAPAQVHPLTGGSVSALLTRKYLHRIELERAILERAEMERP